MKEASSEFLERSKLIELDLEANRIKHTLRMEQLVFERESSKLIHDQILERGRIQRAEERKILAEKEFYRNGR